MNISSEQQKLGGIVIGEVAAGLCRFVYNRSVHSGDVFAGRVLPEDYDEHLQNSALAGGLCSHMSISSYERIIATLHDLGLVKHRAGDVFQLEMDASDIAQLILESKNYTFEQFENCIVAFLQYEFQPGWPPSHFNSDIVPLFRNSGLLEQVQNTDHWSLLMQSFFKQVPEAPWDPQILFKRICE